MSLEGGGTIGAEVGVGWRVPQCSRWLVAKWGSVAGAVQAWSVVGCFALVCPWQDGCSYGRYHPGVSQHVLLWDPLWWDGWGWRQLGVQACCGSRPAGVPRHCSHLLCQQTVARTMALINPSNSGEYSMLPLCFSTFLDNFLYVLFALLNCGWTGLGAHAHRGSRPARVPTPPSCLHFPRGVVM